MEGQIAQAILTYIPNIYRGEMSAPLSTFGGGVAAVVLEKNGVSAQTVEQLIRAQIGSGTATKLSPDYFTPRAKRVVETAMAGCNNIGKKFVGTEHLLIGILSDGDNFAVRFLTELGVDITALTNSVLKASGIDGNHNIQPETERPKNSKTPTLEKYGVPFEVHIFSAHRTPEEAREFARNARQNGFGVLICAAGMAAHLAGAFAGNSTLPVIGIPMKGGAADGLDALLATVQMPSGIPVATVAVNGAMNAGILAVEMLALADEDLATRFAAYKEGLKNKIVKADEELQAVNYEYKV